MLKIVLMLNWGMGLEVLKVLHSLDFVRISAVITRYEEETKDRWRNVVHDFAIQHGYPVIHQECISFAEIRSLIAERSADLLIVHGYMKKIPWECYSAPRYGSVNIHPSLLPKYRGPSPTPWVLKNKETKTGLTLHFINDGYDEGDIIEQAEITVEESDTIDSIIEKQKLTVAALLKSGLAHLVDPNFKPRKQPAFGSDAPRAQKRKDPQS